MDDVSSSETSVNFYRTTAADPKIQASDFDIIFATNIGINGPSLWSTGQSSWLRIQRSGFGSRHYQIFFWVVVGLERGPLSLVMIIVELFQGNSGPGLENRKLTTVGESLRWPRDILYPLKLVLTSLTSGGRSVGRYSSHGLKPWSLVFSLLVEMRSYPQGYGCFGDRDGNALREYWITASLINIINLQLDYFNVSVKAP
jgi:hypothetical protein